jgi:hypothetical protein
MLVCYGSYLVAQFVGFMGIHFPCWGTCGFGCPRFLETQPKQAEEKEAISL